MKTFRFRRISRKSGLPLPSRPDFPTEDDSPLSGVVQGKEASAPEEHVANALQKNGILFLFRYVVGAPKGLPGWKEVDFVVMKNGMVYAMEVDTAFTHRSKEQKDKLHDAVILNDKELSSIGKVWPEVFHIDGDTEASSRENAERYIKSRFGK